MSQIIWCPLHCVVVEVPEPPKTDLRWEGRLLLFFIRQDKNKVFCCAGVAVGRQRLQSEAPVQEVHVIHFSPVVVVMTKGVVGLKSQSFASIKCKHCMPSEGCAWLVLMC